MTKNLSKRSALLMLTFLVSPLAWGAATESDCLEQAEVYGNAQGPAYIDSECLGLAHRNATPSLSVDLRTEDRRVAYGLGNLVAIAAPVPDLPMSERSLGFIAGRNTGLRTVIALTLSSDGSELWVLDSSSRKVLAFDPKVPGNIFPRWESNVGGSSEPVSLRSEGGKAIVTYADGSSRSFGKPRPKQ